MIQWQFCCHCAHYPTPKRQHFPHTVSISAMATSLPIPCSNCRISSRGGGGKYTTIAPKSPRASVDDDKKDCGPHSPPDQMTALILDEDDNNPGGRYDDANESVHYHHHFDGYSCHSCIDHISFLGKCSQSSRSSDRCPPSWVHVFSKSSHPSSLRTKAACIAHIEQPVHQKA